MIKNKIAMIAFSFLSIFVGVRVVKAMDCKLDLQKFEAISKRATIKSLPKELLEMISREVIARSANLDEAIKSFKSFAQVLALSQKINLMDKDYKKIDIILLFSSKFKIPAFIVGQKLGIKLSDDLKKELKEKSIYYIRKT